MEEDEQNQDNDNESADDGVLGDVDGKHADNQTIDEEKKEEVKQPVVAKQQTSITVQLDKGQGTVVVPVPVLSNYTANKGPISTDKLKQVNVDELDKKKRKER